MFQFYICNQIGTGSKEDRYRPALADLAVDWDAAGSEWYNGMDNPAKRYWFGIVSGSATTLDLCDTVATPILPSRVDSLDGLSDPFEILVENHPSKVQLATILEGYGISTSWLSQANTVRDVFRYMVRVASWARIAEGEGNANLIGFLSRNIDSTMNQLTQAQRNAGRDWLISKGLDSNWITANTTVRQVIHYVVENLGFGIVKFFGQNF